MNKSDTIKEKLIEALNTNNKEEVISLLKENRILLKKFSDWSNNTLETVELAKLSDLADGAGAVGKFSGAGGGDCGIAISFDAETKEKIEKSWSENNIYLIKATLSKDGVLIE